MDRLIPLSRRWAALAWAVVWTLVAGAVYWSAVRTAWGQRLDDYLLERWHSEDLLVRLTANGVRSVIPLVLGVLVARLCLVAWRAGRRRVVGLVGAVLLVTAVLSPLLRDVLLTRPDLGGDWASGLADGRNTLPSNHMAFTTALVVAVLVLRRCGARWAGPRPDGAWSDGPGDWTVGALAALLAVEVTVNITTYAHRPADLVAGFAVGMALWSTAIGLSPSVLPGGPVAPEGAPDEVTCAACGETGDTAAGTG